MENLYKAWDPKVVEDYKEANELENWKAKSPNQKL